MRHRRPGARPAGHRRRRGDHDARGGRPTRHHRPAHRTRPLHPRDDLSLPARLQGVGGQSVRHRGDGRHAARRLRVDRGAVRGPGRGARRHLRRHEGPCAGVSRQPLGRRYHRVPAGPLYQHRRRRQRPRGRGVAAIRSTGGRSDRRDRNPRRLCRRARGPALRPGDPRGRRSDAAAGPLRAGDVPRGGEAVRGVGRCPRRHRPFRRARIGPAPRLRQERCRGRRRRGRDSDFG